MNKITTVKGIYPAKRKDGTFISGTSPKGKPWQLFNVVDAQDQKYSGFEIPKEIEVGDEVFVEWEVKENGNFKNNNLKKIYKIEKTVNIETGEESGTKSQPRAGNVSIDQFRALEARVRALETDIGPENNDNETIDPESLPF